MTKFHMTDFSITDFVITHFKSALFVHDHQGKRTEFSSRHYSCFIITIKGCICFTHAGGRLYADPQHPVFLPKGLHYINECLEEADSYLFNFDTLKQHSTPLELAAVSPAFVAARHKTIMQYASGIPFSSPNIMGILSELYALAQELFTHEEPLSASDKTLKKAVQYMQAHYMETTLTIEVIAQNCFVSEVYLRRLFVHKYNTTPFQFLTDVRMKRADMLAKEKRPIKEIALDVGYSDVYQFSRAYKKHFGYPPSKA